MGEWRLTTCMILWRKIQPMLLSLVFVTTHFVFFFTILRGKVSCNLSITDAKPKQMKLTEHSCCFDNEDDGNFFPERRETLWLGFILGLSKGLFNGPGETAHLPLCSPGTSREADFKKFAPNVVSIYIPVWMIEHRYCTPRDCRERLPFLVNLIVFLSGLMNTFTKKRDTCGGGETTGAGKCSFCVSSSSSFKAPFFCHWGHWASVV